MSQPVEALARANARRWALAALRDEIHSGEVAITDLLERREPLLKDYTVFDVVRFSRPTGSGGKATVNQQRMGAEAVRAEINLLISLDRASDRTIRWTVNYIRRHPMVVGHNIHGVKRRTMRYQEVAAS